jgi:hypothetical protein
VTEQFGLASSAALIDTDGERIYGLSRAELFDQAGAAELLVNISGHLTWEPLLRHFRRKAYIDIDPGFTQFWHADPAIPFRLSDHDSYFTIGANIGRPECPIPTGGIDWRPIRQPVVLDEWPVSVSGTAERFTTVGSWRGAFGPVQVADKVYGLKAHEFRRFVELPQRAPQTFEIALNIHPADGKDKALLQRHGWHLVDPLAVSADPLSFRQYVADSGAEFSVAQAIYVDTHSGWFSDRTTRYLASGKPALVQETGFSRYLPVGQGLLSFTTLEEAVEGAARIQRDYESHARAARELAERYFDSQQVLAELIDQTGMAS